MENFQNIANAIGSVPGLIFLWVGGETSVQFFGSSTRRALVMLDDRCILVAASSPEEDWATHATNPVSCGRKFKFLIFCIQNLEFYYNFPEILKFVIKKSFNYPWKKFLQNFWLPLGFASFFT